MQTIDKRCGDPKCSPNMYRMVGQCSNCGTEGLLVLFTAGHESEPADCPVCECYRTVGRYRLATDDEFPAAVAEQGEDDDG